MSGLSVMPNNAEAPIRSQPADRLKYGTARAIVESRARARRVQYWPARCRLCGCRRTLPKHPDDYARGHARCINCKTGTMRVDYYRATRMFPKDGTGSANACRCDGYRFPHCKGSLYCEHYEGEKKESRWLERFGDEYASPPPHFREQEKFRCSKLNTRLAA